MRLKGRPIKEALKLAHIFSEMVQGKDPEDLVEDEDLDLGDIEALSGVCKFPARIKCATLAWKAMEKALHEEKE